MRRELFIGTCIFNLLSLLPFYRAVYADKETGVYYDVVLSKVDVKWGRYGLNVFYKLQVRVAFCCMQ